MTSEKAAVVDAGAKRIFHVTHVRNLAGILTDGRLLADAAGAQPVVDLSSADNRALRRAAQVAAGGVVADYVPFFLSPNAYLWDEVRAQVSDGRGADSRGADRRSTDERLSPDVRQTPASDFVVLVSTVRAAGEGVVVADGDAADPLTRFTTLAELVRGASRKFDEDDAELSAEFLVRDAFPFGAVTLIGVANDKARAEVRAILKSTAQQVPPAAATFSPKISVYPPWFQRP